MRHYLDVAPGHECGNPTRWHCDNFACEWAVCSPCGVLFHFGHDLAVGCCTTRREGDA